MSAMSPRTTIVVTTDEVAVTIAHEPGDERTAERLRTLDQSFDALWTDEPDGALREPRGSLVPDVAIGVPAKEAALYVQGPSRPNRGVDDQTVRRYIRDGVLLALRSAEKGYLVPLGQFDPAGLPLPRLRAVLDPIGEDVRHEAATIVWFLTSEVGQNRETPVRLLRRDEDDDLTRVANAVSRRWPRST